MPRRILHSKMFFQKKLDLTSGLLSLCENCPANNTPIAEEERRSPPKSGDECLFGGTVWSTFRRVQEDGMYEGRREGCFYPLDRLPFDVCETCKYRDRRVLDEGMDWMRVSEAEPESAQESDD